MIDVIIYTGQGAFGSSVPSIESLINRRYSCKISRVTEKNFTPSTWDPNNTLCIFPGGHANELEKVLNEQFEELRSFFKNGGKGLFLCGSSFAAAKSRKYLEIEKQGKLKLFNGQTVGPLFPDPEVTWQNRAVKLIWEKDCETGYSLSVGGGYYLPKNLEEITVLAKYKDGQVAALMHRYGRGAVVHSMVHFEIPNFSVINDSESLRLFEKRNPTFHHSISKLDADFLEKSFHRLLQNLHLDLWCLEK